MVPPDYAFTIPSLFDAIPIDCRVYIPKHPSYRIASTIKGAIFAHPYGPLGGSYDDFVVLAVTKCLLQQGFIVATFNFRGAGASAGKTSWTGRPEADDYASIVGFMCFYLDHLSECFSKSSVVPDRPVVVGAEKGHSAAHQLVLGGYSFGSLIVAKLPSVSEIVERFDSKERSDSASVILDRALTLGTRSAERLTAESRDKDQDESQHKDRSSTYRASPLTVGGEDTGSPSRKREHHVRSIPKILKHTIRRHSNPSRMRSTATETSAPVKVNKHITFEIEVRYLLVSPVLVPFSTILPPVGAPSLLALLGMHDSAASEAKGTGFMSLLTSTLVAFGTSDNFTSAKRLRQWTERLARRSDGRLQWFALDDAGHFWREEGAITTLQSRIMKWVSEPTY